MSRVALISVRATLRICECAPDVILAHKMPLAAALRLESRTVPTQSPRLKMNGWH
jgi:hypothetical protein